MYSFHWKPGVGGQNKTRWHHHITYRNLDFSLYDVTFSVHHFSAVKSTVVLLVCECLLAWIFFSASFLLIVLTTRHDMLYCCCGHSQTNTLTQYSSSQADRITSHNFEGYSECKRLGKIHKRQKKGLCAETKQRWHKYDLGKRCCQMSHIKTILSWLRSSIRAWCLHDS